MKERLEAIKQSALEQINQAQKMENLNDIKVNFLGKKGRINKSIKRHERRCQRRSSKSRTDGQ